MATYDVPDKSTGNSLTASEFNQIKDCLTDGTRDITCATINADNLPTGDIVGTTDTQTLTNKTIDSASNTITLDLSEISITGTTSEFNTALSDGSFVTLDGTETLTNKTLTSPSIDVTSDATGDVYYRDGSGNFTRLGIGTATQVLTVNSGATAPEWADASGGGGSGNPQDTISIDGEVSTGTKAVFAMSDERNGLVVKEVRLIALGLPTGADLQVDICKNGTATTDSIFTSDVPIEIGTGQSATNGVYQVACDTSGARVGTPGTTLDSARDDVASDDVLYVIIRQVGSTIAGSDLRVIITYGSA